MVLFKIDEDLYKLDRDLYKIDWILIPYSKWKQIGVFHFVIENKISVVFCLETSRLSFVLKTVCLLGTFLKNMSFCWLKVDESCRKVEKYAENMQKVEENEVSIAFC